MTSTTRHFAYDPVPGSEIAGPTAGLYQRDIRNLFNLTLAERFGRLFFRAEIPPRVSSTGETGETTPNASAIFLYRRKKRD